jgi:Uncharacterized conserved protein (COG2071).
MSFLTAEWRNLAIANYEIDAAILKPFIPAKTEFLKDLNHSPLSHRQIIDQESYPKTRKPREVVQEGQSGKQIAH